MINLTTGKRGHIPSRTKPGISSDGVAAKFCYQSLKKYCTVLISEMHKPISSVSHQGQVEEGWVLAPLKVLWEGLFWVKASSLPCPPFYRVQ